VIRAVTIIEVFTRRNLATLIDQSEEYTQRAVDVTKHFKMDFDLVRHIQGRAITLGDIVGHSVSVNSFGQIISHFETILAKPLRPLLADAIDRFAVEVKREPKAPIIRDYDKLAERLSQLFELRHILCHELPSKRVYGEGIIDEFLDCAIQFTKALQEVLTFEQFGLIPLTQTDMNIQAHEDLLKTEEQMSALLSQLRSHVTQNDQPFPGKWEGTWVGCLDDAQEKWLSYRNSQCEFETYLNRGGTIRSMIWSSAAERLTKNRIAELQSSWEHITQM